MIVPAKKLNVHLINRVGSSDCAHQERGEERTREGGKKEAERSAGARSVLGFYTYSSTSSSSSSRPLYPRARAPFGFPPKFRRPAGRTRRFRAGDRVRSITLSVNH